MPTAMPGPPAAWGSIHAGPAIAVRVAPFGVSPLTQPAGFGSSASFIAYVPVDGFLPWLLAGWRFPRDVAQPMAGAHGLWSCLMERADA